MNWISNHYIEIIGAITGIIYLYFEVKENKWLWPLGLVTSLFYVYIFFQSKFYADMGLQVYYVVISIYGWWMWRERDRKTETGDGELQTEDCRPKTELPIIRLSAKLGWILTGVTILIFFFIAYILKHFTDSPLPYWDAFTTSLSIVATWMLTRKILEQWYLWMIVNAVSLGLYVYKGLYPTVVLFVFYTVMSYVGYRQWKKSM